MKQILLIILAALFGAFTYWAVSPYFVAKQPTEETDHVLEARLEAQRRVDEARRQQENSTTEEPETQTIDAETSPPVNAAETFGVRTLGPFEIVGTDDHPASGHVEIVDSPEEKIVHFKDYEGSAGAELNVYLSKDLEAEDFFDLGPAKDTRGDLVYGVPLGLNISEYRYVLTWDEESDELFDYAEIN